MASRPSPMASPTSTVRTTSRISNWRRPCTMSSTPFASSRSNLLKNGKLLPEEIGEPIAYAAGNALEKHSRRREVSDFSAYPRWHDVPLEYWEAWNRIFGASQEGLELAAPCPVCGVPALRQWYMVGRLQETVLRGQRFIARGSVWTWCSHCHTYAHYSGLVPEWWSSDLDVNTDTLGHQPTAIEEARLAREYRIPGAADAAEKDARSLPAGDERTERFTELAMALATAGIDSALPHLHAPLTDPRQRR